MQWFVYVQNVKMVPDIDIQPTKWKFVGRSIWIKSYFVEVASVYILYIYIHIILFNFLGLVSKPRSICSA